MYGIIADVKRDRVLLPGSKVRILDLDGDAGYPLVVGSAKRGGTIAKFIRSTHLQNFRAVWVGQELREQWLRLYETKEQALRAVLRLAGSYSERAARFAASSKEGVKGGQKGR